VLHYRFGVGDFDWKEFTSRMKQKTYEEIKEYCHDSLTIFVMIYIILSVYLKHVFAGIYFELIFAGRKGDRI
jgi:hypothetical protein